LPPALLLLRQVHVHTNASNSICAEHHALQTCEDWWCAAPRLKINLRASMRGYENCLSYTILEKCWLVDEWLAAAKLTNILGIVITNGMTTGFEHCQGKWMTYGWYWLMASTHCGQGTSSFRVNQKTIVGCINFSASSASQRLNRNFWMKPKDIT
jgi:hypothetical protein